jgi:hypothetical protein
MVRFKCNQSGNIFEFHNEHDIKTMRTHPEYTEITATVVLSEETENKPVKRTYNKVNIKE